MHDAGHMTAEQTYPHLLRRWPRLSQPPAIKPPLSCISQRGSVTWLCQFNVNVKCANRFFFLALLFEQNADKDATPFNGVYPTLGHIRTCGDSFFIGSSVHFVLCWPLHNVADVCFCTSSRLWLSVPSHSLGSLTFLPVVQHHRLQLF